MSKPRDAQEARAQGYIVDESCSPWVAYKGPRFNPTEWFYLLTDTESAKMTESEYVLQELRAKGKALAKLRDGIVQLISQHPNMAPKLRKLLEESYKAECWND